MKDEEQVVDAQQVGEEATRFMSGLLEAFGLQGDVSLVQDGDDLEVQVAGDELGLLVGPRGTTLQAVQDITRVASQRRLGDHDTRLRVDVGGYRERRRVALGAFAVKMADEVKTSGVARVLEPMSSADRKVIHDTLGDVEGIVTRSEGDDPYRRVVIAPAND
jgi:spoIIIJ-associated protein